MWYQLIFACAIIANVYGSLNWSSKLVYTLQGPVRGYTQEGGDIYQFFNIPYATVPKGVDKFKAPLPPPTWNDTRHAHNEGIVCPQTMLQPLPYNRQEDCLVANVHVPQTTDTNLLPVVVIVHTAAFLQFNSHMSSPNFLVETKKVIAVTFNYRMGANGFLCLGTEFAPGNAGLKDQVALLRWVRDNIRGFGGDPNNVTIAGCSSGVDLLVLSKMTDGLFHKVISDSQCSLSSSVVEFDPLRMARERAGNDFKLENPHDFEKLEEFYDIYSSLMIDEYILRLGEFMPCVEKDVGQEMFLDDAPYNILTNGSYKKLPTLYGYSGIEAFRWRNISAELDDMNEAFYRFLPRDLAFESSGQRALVGDAVKNHYFGDEVNKTDSLAFVKYLTDLEVYPILRAVSLQVSAGNDQVYLYEFSFTDANSPAIPDSDERGASSCDLFGTAFGRLGQNPTAEREAMAKTLRDLYVNFITTGNPTPSEMSLPNWLPVNSTDRSPHYSIGDTIQLAGVPRRDMAAFWDRIYEDNEIVLPIRPNSAASVKNIWSVYAVAVALCLILQNYQ